MMLTNLPRALLNLKLSRRAKYLAVFIIVIPANYDFANLATIC